MVGRSRRVYLHEYWPLQVKRLQPFRADRRVNSMVGTALWLHDDDTLRQPVSFQPTAGLRLGYICKPYPTLRIDPTAKRLLQPHLRC